jgi:hypothetical protein
MYAEICGYCNGRCFETPFSQGLHSHYSGQKEGLRVKSFDAYPNAINYSKFDNS